MDRREIPIRLSGGSAGIQEFMNRLYPQTPRPQSRVIARDPLGRISVAGPRLPSADPQPDPRAPFGFRKDVMDRLTGIQPTMGTVPSLPPKKPMSFMDRISPELGTPASAGLGAAAARGLQLSGYSEVPVTTAQGLGAMMQSGMEAFQAAKAAETAGKRADLADRLAIENARTARIKAEPSGPLTGTSKFAQSGNILLGLAAKIKNGTATAEEKALYSYTYANAVRPDKFTTFDQATGQATTTEVPAMDLPTDIFPRPEGMREPLVTEKPSTQQLKDVLKIKDTAKMLANLNTYRTTLQNPEFSVTQQIGGAAGFPSALASTASSQSEALRMDLKKLYELGALVGGDFQILDNLLTSPNTAKAIKGGRDFLLAQLSQLEKQLELDLAEKGVQLKGTQSLPIIANDADAYEAAPNYTFIKLPNGNIVFKNPHAGGK